MELEAEGECERRPDRPRHRLRSPRHRRREARLEPVRAYDHEPPALEAAAANAEANAVDLDLERVNLREGLPELSPTVVANMTTPVLTAVATQLDRNGGLGGVFRSNSGEAPEDPTQASATVAPRDPTPTPTTLVCSGILPAELDEVAAAFASAGLTESTRRQEGDWAALALRRR